jgi:hypothetical protein
MDRQTVRHGRPAPRPSFERRRGPTMPARTAAAARQGRERAWVQTGLASHAPGGVQPCIPDKGEQKSCSISTLPAWSPLDRCCRRRPKPLILTPCPTCQQVQAHRALCGAVTGCDEAQHPLGRQAQVYQVFHRSVGGLFRMELCVCGVVGLCLFKGSRRGGAWKCGVLIHWRGW